MNEVGMERMRQEFASVRNLAGDGRACPSAAELWDSAMETIHVTENEKIVLHLAACGVCAASWRMAGEMQKEATQQNGLRGTVRRSRQLVRPRWVGLAAAAVLIMVAGIVIVRQLETVTPPQPAYRAAPWGDLAPLTDPAVPLPRNDMTLRWKGAPQGTIYDLRVTTDRLVSLHRAFDIETTSYQVPSEKLAALPPGSIVFWTVTARLPDGRIWNSRAFQARVE
jgi:hypothetical protein